MENVQQQEQPKLQTEDANKSEHERPKIQSIIISANGLIIKSKLNPEAKEFYPSYLHKREISEQCVTSRKIPVKLTVLLDVPGIKEPKDNINTVKQEETMKERTHESGDKEIIMGITDKIGEVDEIEEINKTEESKNNILKPEKTELEKDLVVEEQFAKNESPKDIEKLSKVEEEHPENIKNCKVLFQKSVEENKIPHEIENNIDEMFGCQEKNIMKVEIASLTEKVFNNENDRIKNIVDERIGCLTEDEFNEEKELQEFQNSLDNTKENVCVDIKSENIAHVGNTGEYGDSVDHSAGEGSGNEAQQKVETESDSFDFQINKLSESQTKITPTMSTCVLVGKAPPTTPTEEYFELRSQEECLELLALKEKSNTKEEKSKTEKKSAGKKITKLFLGACRKSTSTFCEKSTSKSTTKTNTSSNVTTHTKRISESLHNLSTTLKSKSDVKKSEGSTRLVPRSTTNIPRNPLRSRTLLSKPSEANGLKKDAAKLAPKDAVSLRSTSSTEKSITSKSSVHGSNKTLNSKTSNTSTKYVEKPSSTSLASKPKETITAAQKLPRATVASSLRQTEAHKRRNLFPNDDPEANIELSQFLFK